MTEARAPLDAELAAIVAALPPSDGSSIFDLPSDVARGIFDAGMAPTDEALWAGVFASITDTLAEHDGHSVPVRVYRPKGEREFPVLVFFHGGGFMLGGIDQMDEIARRLARDVGAVVVSVGYRKAPEHRYPAALDDAQAVTGWVLNNAATLGGDANRVALVGESSGGNLALSAALRLRGTSSRLAALLLVVPGVDLGPVVEDLDCPLLGAADMRAIARNYLGEDFGPADRYPPSPLYAEDLSGLPPIVLAIAGHDILAPSNEAFASRVVEAGAEVVVRRFGDMFHPFFGFAPVSRGAARASDVLCGDLARLLGSTPAETGAKKDREQLEGIGK